MSPETIEAIIKLLVQQWGIVALFLVLMAISFGISMAQVRQMRRWTPETKEIAILMRESVGLLKEITDKMDAQHTTCTKHYDFAQRQIEGMASIGHELSAVVAAIGTSDRERAREIMQLMTVIAGHPRP